MSYQPPHTGSKKPKCLPKIIAILWVFIKCVQVTLEPLQCLDLYIFLYLDNWLHDEYEPDKYHGLLIKCPVEALAQNVNHEKNHSTTL